LRAKGKRRAGEGEGGARKKREGERETEEKTTKNAAWGPARDGMPGIDATSR